MFCRSEIVKVRRRLPKINTDGALIAGIERPVIAGGVGAAMSVGTPLLTNMMVAYDTLGHSVKIEKIFNQIW